MTHSETLLFSWWKKGCKRVKSELAMIMAYRIFIFGKTAKIGVKMPDHCLHKNRKSMLNYLKKLVIYWKEDN
jgi:hypothetical protein